MLSGMCDPGGESGELVCCEQGGKASGYGGGKLCVCSYVDTSMTNTWVAGDEQNPGTSARGFFANRHLAREWRASRLAEQRPLV